MQSFELSVTCGMRQRAGSRLQNNMKLLVQLCHASDYMASTVTKKINATNQALHLQPETLHSWTEYQPNIVLWFY